MGSIQRQRVVWTGFTGSPGLSTFYFADAATAQAALHAFMASVALVLPSIVRLQIEPGGDVIDETTGALTGIWAGSAQAVIPGNPAGGAYAAPVGALIRWETLAIRSGSRLRGRTYLVPAASSVFDTNGTMESGALATLVTAAGDFIGSVTPNLVVWQRPRGAQVAYVDGRGIPHKAVSGRGGSSAPVILSSVPDEAVVLRSRRD